MKFNVFTEKYYEALTNSEDKKNFLNRYFSGSKTFSNMPVITTKLYDAKTITQNGTIWRDWSIVAKLMYTAKETVYYWCLKNPQFQDIWLEKSSYGKNKNRSSYRFRSLSDLSFEETVDFIPRYREFLQAIVNREHQEYVVINWSKFENIDKPDYEFTS